MSEYVPVQPDYKAGDPVLFNNPQHKPPTIEEATVIEPLVNGDVLIQTQQDVRDVDPSTLKMDWLKRQ